MMASVAEWSNALSTRSGQPVRSRVRSMDQDLKDMLFCLHKYISWSNGEYTASYVVPSEVQIENSFDKVNINSEHLHWWYFLLK